MTTLTIEIPEKVEKTLSDLIEQLGGKVVTTDTTAKESSKLRSDEKLSRKDKKFIKEFEEAIEFVNLHQQGKVQAKSIEQLFAGH